MRRKIRRVTDNFLGASAALTRLWFVVAGVGFLVLARRWWVFAGPGDRSLRNHGIRERRLSGVDDTTRQGRSRVARPYVSRIREREAGELTRSVRRSKRRFSPAPLGSPVTIRRRLDTKPRVLYLSRLQGPAARSRSREWPHPAGPAPGG